MSSLIYGVNIWGTESVPSKTTPVSLGYKSSSANEQQR